MDTLFKKHRMLISQVSTEIIRDAMNTIKWDKHLVAIRGSRGVGKPRLCGNISKRIMVSRQEKPYTAFWTVCISPIIHCLTSQRTST